MRSRELREDFDLTRLNEISIRLLIIHNDNDDTVLSLVRIYMRLSVVATGFRNLRFFVSYVVILLSFLILPRT